MGAAEQSPNQIWWQAVEPVWRTISIYDGPAKFLRAFGAAEQYRALLFAVWWCNSEVCNGGFLQFFCKPTGVLAPEAATGLRAIGMPELASVVEEGMAGFGKPYPRKQEIRLRLLDRRPFDGGPRPLPFDSLDTRYYKLKREPIDLETAAAAFAKASS